MAGLYSERGAQGFCYTFVFQYAQDPDPDPGSGGGIGYCYTFVFLSASGSMQWTRTMKWWNASGGRVGQVRRIINLRAYRVRSAKSVMLVYRH